MRNNLLWVSVFALLPACSVDSGGGEELPKSLSPAGSETAEPSPTIPFGSSGEVPQVCDPLASIDVDGDGFSEEEGDCDDCSADISPAAYDDPQNGTDDDCSGDIDDAPSDCDSFVSDLEDPDPFKAVATLGMCRDASNGGWGLLTARYTSADGADLSEGSARGHGLLARFGEHNVPLAGSRLLALSSGTAREPGDVGYASPSGFQQGSEGPTPAGFSASAPACPGVEFVQHALDSVALEVTLRAPENAKSFSFDFNFFTYEFPKYICSKYNDFFVVLMDDGVGGEPSKNISFDNDGNPVSVNNGLLEVCESQEAGGKLFDCPLGDQALLGTGFEQHAATGWLTTNVPVSPGATFRLRFVIWDAGDPMLDSTVLIDNFRFSVEERSGASTSPVIR